MLVGGLINAALKIPRIMRSLRKQTPAVSGAFSLSRQDDARFRGLYACRPTSPADQSSFQLYEAFGSSGREALEHTQLAIVG